MWKTRGDVKPAELPRDEEIKIVTAVARSLRSRAIVKCRQLVGVWL